MYVSGAHLRNARMAEIFISYKSERRPAARHLKKVLDCYFKDSGEECVWYDYGLIPGDDFEPRIMAEIAKAKVALVLWCGMAVTSPWVRKEAAEARRTGKFLPVRIESCALPEEFSGADTINLSEWDASPRSPMLDRLLDDIGRRIEREPVSRIARLREFGEDWQDYGAPSLAHFALGKPLEPGSSAPAPLPATAPILGPPPAGLSDNFAAIWERAREGGTTALNLVGLGYYKGLGGLTRDYHEAVRLWRFAADQGLAEAQARLGRMHRKGLGGLPKDDHEAVRLFRLAADRGNASAQCNLGFMYANGRGVAKDEREAARLYKLAADQGDAIAQTNLALMYWDGKGGLTKDNREAARLCMLAADQGNAAAQSNLGWMYETGFGDLPIDELEAVRLYKLAADKGDALGQRNLGGMYRYGRGGLPKDEREAARLYKLAARGGDEWAQNELKRRGETW
jgi:TPR repeat protein